MNTAAAPSRDPEAILRASDPLLTEGAVIERLKREFRLSVHPDIVPGLLYEADPAGRKALATICRQYVAIAGAHGLPIIIMTPTRRVSRERLDASPYRNRDVIGDSVGFLRKILAAAPEPRPPDVLVGGLMGCRGDAYDGRDALDAAEAARFHRWKSERFREAGVDFLFAGIMPAVSEALGIARAMAAAGRPYIVSFMIRRSGRLLDGTTLHDAIAAIDGGAEPRPVCYMANCVHPHVLRDALSAPGNRTALVAERLAGLQANTSPLAPEELDGRGDLAAEEPERLAEAMMALRAAHGLRILGGCCGTDGRHLEALARRLRPRAD